MGFISPLLSSEGPSPRSHGDSNPNLLTPNPMFFPVPNLASPKEKEPGASRSWKGQGGGKTEIKGQFISGNIGLLTCSQQRRRTVIRAGKEVAPSEKLPTSGDEAQAILSGQGWGGVGCAGLFYWVIGWETSPRMHPLSHQHWLKKIFF